MHMYIKVQHMQKSGIAQYVNTDSFWMEFILGVIECKSKNH